MAEHALLLDRRRLGIALGDDQAAQYGAEFTRNLLPDFLPIVVAKANLAVGIAVREKDSPAVLRHVDESISGPTLRVHRGRGAKINVRHLKIARTEVLPPLQKFRLPVFQSALQGAVGAEVYVVRNAILIIDCHCKAPISEFRFRTCNRVPDRRRLCVGWGGHTLSQLKRAFDPVPNSLSAPCSPVEFGRMNTQFCHAGRRPNTLVSVVSAPGKRRLASMPVSASGESAARSSTAIRISSSQSRSSGAKVTRPSSRASLGPSSLPLASTAPAMDRALPLKRVSSRPRALTAGSRPKFISSTAIFEMGASPSSSGSASM